MKAEGEAPTEEAGGGGVEEEVAEAEEEKRNGEKTEAMMAGSCIKDTGIIAKQKKQKCI